MRLSERISKVRKPFAYLLIFLLMTYIFNIIAQIAYGHLLARVLTIERSHIEALLSRNSASTQFDSGSFKSRAKEIGYFCYRDSNLSNEVKVLECRKEVHSTLFQAIYVTVVIHYADEGGNIIDHSVLLDSEAMFF